MAKKLTTINFYGKDLYVEAGADPTTTMVAMKSIVEGMGLDWSTQHTKITAHPMLSKGIQKITIPSNGGPQLTIALPLSRINFWLATVNANMVKASLRDKVIQYQDKCADVLFEHCFPVHAVDQAPRLTKGEVARLMAAIVHKQMAESEARLIAQATEHEERMNAKAAESEERIKQQAAELEAKVMAIANGFDKTRFSIIGFRPAVRILDDLQIPSKGRRGLSQRCSSAMRNWADARDRFKDKQRSPETNTWLFHVDLIRDWLKAEGSAIIQNFKDEKKGQTVMPFMVVNNTEPKSDDK